MRQTILLAHCEISMSWIVSLLKRYAHAKYSPKLLKYIRNYTSVHTECIKVLSRDRQVGRRNIRSLAAAAVSLFPFLSLFYLSPFSLAKEQNFFSIHICIFLYIYVSFYIRVPYIHTTASLYIRLSTECLGI